MHKKYIMKSTYGFFIAILVVFSSCVTPGKYKSALEENNRLKRENDLLSSLKEENRSTKKQLEDLNSKLANTEDVLYEVNSKYTSAKEMYEKCQNQYDKMLMDNKKILDKAFADKSGLSEELADKQKTLESKEQRLKSLEKELNNQKLTQDLLQNDLLSRKKKIDSLNTLIQSKDDKLKTIKTKITDLLSGYSNDDIMVEKRSDGKLYISMSQNLLFKKGSDKIDPVGIDVIKNITSAIKTESGFSVLVEGHTDTDGSPSLNWDLSVARAVAVVKVMEQNGIMPQKITAAGRGQYMPVLPNSNETNKSKNRRTEIILEPNVNEIIELLK